MKERDEKRGGGVAVIWTAVALMVILPILYVASIGLAAWMVRKMNSGGDVFNAVYYPLRITEGTWLGRAIGAYLEPWSPDPFAAPSP
jgi:hypothetical protein